MTALSEKHGAYNLAQGLMWLPPDPHLLEEARSAFTDHTLHQYSSPAGVPALRTAIAMLSEKFFETPYDPDREITITAGATEAIFSAIQALTLPGDEALFIEPAYDSYLPAFQSGNVQARAVPMEISEKGARLDWEAVAASLSEKTRILLLNFPHNPTGRALHLEDVHILETLVARYPRLYLVVDEAYEYMYWHPDPSQATPLPPLSVRQSPILREKSVIIGSLGKILGTTGWRLGYIAAPAELTARIRAVHQFITFCAPTPLQIAAAKYLHSNPNRVFFFHDTLLARRKLFVELLRTYTSLKILPPEGGYFVLIRPTENQLPDIQLAEHLTREAKVASIPLSPFYGDGTDPGWLRLCFARSVDMLKNAAQRLGEVYPADQPTDHLTE
ncbi:MAG: aminotransferase class I/II-fold pyridoxal phosphate-dependent enzyme [Bacteroidia bacterium]|nr:aminotransferase class I/II-fold pyridoxal phosphate-dependent enzyme [Bacteroidia bacterium]